MYLKNGFFVKNQWFYILPIGLFLLINVNAFFAPEVDLKPLIAQMGELPFFVMNVGIFLIFFLGLFFIVKFIHQQPIVKFTTGRKRIDWGRIFFSFSLWGGYLVLQTGLSYLLFPDDYQWNFEPVPFFTLLLLSLLFIPFQAGFEEYFFRGYFLQGVSILSKRRWVPLVLSSLFFGLVHIANPEVSQMGYGFLVFYICSGLFLGIITLMDNGLELALGFHIANNIFISILTTSSWSVFQTPSLLKEVSTPEVTPLYAINFFLPLLILLFIFAKKYRWNDWRTRLFGKIN